MVCKQNCMNAVHSNNILYDLIIINICSHPIRKNSPLFALVDTIHLPCFVPALQQQHQNGAYTAPSEHQHDASPGPDFTARNALWHHSLLSIPNSASLRVIVLRPIPRRIAASFFRPWVCFNADLIKMVSNCRDNCSMTSA